MKHACSLSLAFAFILSTVFLRLEIASAESCIETYFPGDVNFENGEDRLSPLGDAAFEFNYKSVIVSSLKNGKVTKIDGEMLKPVFNRDGTVSITSDKKSEDEPTRKTRSDEIETRSSFKPGEMRIVDPQTGTVSTRDDLLWRNGILYKRGRSSNPQMVRLEPETKPKIGAQPLPIEISRADLNRPDLVLIPGQATYAFQTTDGPWVLSSIEIRGGRAPLTVPVALSAQLYPGLESQGQVVAISKFWNGNTKTIETIDTLTGQKKKIEMPPPSARAMAEMKYSMSMPTPDAQTRATGVDRFYRKLERLNKLRPRPDNITVSADGKFLAIRPNRGEGATTLVDLKTGKIKPATIANSSFTASGLLCSSELVETGNGMDAADLTALKSQPMGLMGGGLVGGMGRNEKRASPNGLRRTRCANPETGQETIDMLMPNKNIGAYGAPIANSPPLGLKRVCFPGKVSIRCACGNCKNFIADSLKESVSLALCTKPFAEADWRFLDPAKTEISDNDAMAWLRRFSKPGGFDSAKHTGVLLGILDSGIQLSRSGMNEARAALNGVYAQAPEIYRAALQRHPEFLIDKSKRLEATCPTTIEKKEIEAGVIDSLLAEYQMHSDRGYKTTKEATDFARLNLSREGRDLLAEELADRLLEDSTRESPTRSLFASRVHKVLRGRLSEDLGLSSEAVIEFDIPRRDPGGDMYARELNGYVVASAPGAGFFELPSGLYLKPVEVSKKMLPQGTEKELTTTWETGNQSYSAQIKLHAPKVESELYRRAKSPDYASWKKDGVVRGTVVVSPNLHGIEKGVKEN